MRLMYAHPFAISGRMLNNKCGIVRLSSPAEPEPVRFDYLIFRQLTRLWGRLTVRNFVCVLRAALRRFYEITDLNAKAQTNNYDYAFARCMGKCAIEAAGVMCCNRNNRHKAAMHIILYIFGMRRHTKRDFAEWQNGATALCRLTHIRHIRHCAKVRAQMDVTTVRRLMQSHTTMDNQNGLIQRYFIGIGLLDKREQLK